MRNPKCTGCVKTLDEMAKSPDFYTEVRDGERCTTCGQRWVLNEEYNFVAVNANGFTVVYA
jgi:hypothetical protein